MRVSVVTPCFNNAGYLEATMRSILGQHGCELEYIVMDGGSTDGSAEIIGKFKDRLAYWRSGPDGGAYEAVSDGFARATGEVMGWLNASDLYLPWTLATVADIFARHPEIGWLTSLHPVHIDAAGRCAGMPHRVGYTAGALRGRELGLAASNLYIQQESCFWRRDLWEKAGGRIPRGHPYAGDLALWAEFFQLAPCYGVQLPLAAFRFHPKQRSGDGRYEQDAVSVVERSRSLPEVPHEHLFGSVRPLLAPPDRELRWDVRLRDAREAWQTLAPEGAEEGEDLFRGVRALRHRMDHTVASRARIGRRLVETREKLASARRILANERAQMLELRKRLEVEAERAKPVSCRKSWWSRIGGRLGLSDRREGSD